MHIAMKSADLRTILAAILELCHEDGHQDVK